jgi:peptide-methionine (S)-S-oxide reductase
MFDFLFGAATKTRLVDSQDALPGRPSRPFALTGVHTVLGTPIEAPPPPGRQEIVLGMGCFWGAEEIYWRMDGVWTTAVGYAGGYTAHPTYEETCSARTGHAEVARIVFDPSVLSLHEVLAVFWQSHDPTQGMRQGNDVGSQYRSAIYWTMPEQREAALATRDAYQSVLTQRGLGEITTEIRPLSTDAPDSAGPLYYAEDYHQQYLHKNPYGYRCHSTTGVAFPG